MTRSRRKWKRKQMWLAPLALLLTVVPGQGQTAPRLVAAVSQKPEVLTIFDPSARKIVASVPLGEDPHELVVSDDGKLAFVSSPTRDCIDVIDLGARKVLRSIDTMHGSAPHGMLLREGKLYFTAGGFKSIGRYDLAGDRLDWIFGIGQNVGLLTATRDSKLIFASSRPSNDIVAIQPAAGRGGDWVYTLIPATRAPQAMDVSPDQKELWTSNREAGDISIIDIAAKRVLQTLPAVTTYSYRLAFTPDGKRVLVTNPNSDELVVLDATTRKEIKRLKMGKKPSDILLEPDGSRAYVGRVNEVAILDLTTLEVTGAIPTGNYIEAMAWVSREP